MRICHLRFREITIQAQMYFPANIFSLVYTLGKINWSVFRSQMKLYSDAVDCAYANANCAALSFWFPLIGLHPIDILRYLFAPTIRKNWIKASLLMFISAVLKNITLDEY